MSEDAPELTAELVADGVVPSQPVISPDGCRVAYVVAPARPGTAQRDDTYDLTGHAFHPDDHDARPDHALSAGTGAVSRGR